MESPRSTVRWSWLLSVLLGAVAVLFTSFGLVALLIALAGVVALAIRHAGVVGLSGVLTGSGAFWTFLIARVLASGATQDNAIAWVVVGLVPWALGLVLLAYSLRQRRVVARRAEQ